jgi:PAS domain S-box-containing protein
MDDVTTTAGEAMPGSGRTIDYLSDLGELAWFEVDAERNIVAMSPALERMTGFRAEDVLGRSCLTAIRCSECLKGCGVFRHGTVRDARLRIYRADGSEVEVLKSGRVLRDEAGEITGAIEMIRLPGEGFTGSVGLPPELSAMLGGLGREFVMADEELRITGISAGLPALLGVEESELRARPLADVFGEEVFGEGSSVRDAVLAGERREGWRASLRAAGGDHVPVSLSIGPIDATETCGGLDARVIVMIRPDDAEPGEVPSFGGIVSRSTDMQRIFRIIELLKDNDSTVLITGESGTGKELIARALHDTSHRAGGPFVTVNCAAIPNELLESELFGHVRGAFTGAVRDRPGRFELADGGTLFLDEIGDLALGLQAKLLRFLQEHTFERVGDTRTRRVDVRVLAATHVDLVRAVAERGFREDLYYRLRVVPIEIPPLRERREDLELLIRFFMDRIGRDRGRSLRLAPSASRALLDYSWPGNVRELQNAVEYATTVCEGQTIHLRDLPSEVERHGGRGPDRRGSNLEVGADWSESTPPEGAPTDVVEVAARRSGLADGLSPAEASEAHQILRALEASRYHRGEAAERLGVSRTTLWRKMKQYRL